MRKKLAALMLTGAIALAPMQPAYALFGVGDIVIDPTNLAQNILTAARPLEIWGAGVGRRPGKLKFKFPSLHTPEMRRR